MKNESMNNEVHFPVWSQKADAYHYLRSHTKWYQKELKVVQATVDGKPVGWCVVMRVGRSDIYG